jgi:hypothetical protein
MPHLIQPIALPGAGLYCPSYHGNRATRGIDTMVVTGGNDAVDFTTPESPWNLNIVGIASTFELSFGVACGDTVNFSYDGMTTSDDWQAVIAIHINQNPVAAYLEILSSGLTYGSLAISLSDVACGNIVTVWVSMTDDSDTPTEDLLVTLGVTSIT